MRRHRSPIRFEVLPSGGSQKRSHKKKNYVITDHSQLCSVAIQKAKLVQAGLASSIAIQHKNA